MTKVILVNYAGGYCGNFISYLIGDALGVKYNLITDEEKNSYYFQSDEIDTKHIKPFGKLFEIRRGDLKINDLEIITRLKLDKSYEYLLQLYKIVYDEDEAVFIGNIKTYYQDLMNSLKAEYFITNIHYGYKYKDLSLQDVFKESIVIHIGTMFPKYARLFTLLLYSKIKDDKADQILQSSTLSKKYIFENIIKPVPPKSFNDQSIYVDMGTLLFEKDIKQLDDLEINLLSSFGINLTLNRKKFFEYADKNIKIVETILGKNFVRQSEDEQIEKSLSYINNFVKYNER